MEPWRRSIYEKIGEYENLNNEERLIIAGDVLKAGLAAKSGVPGSLYSPQHREKT
jgi:hypothetical protein